MHPKFWSNPEGNVHIGVGLSLVGTASNSVPTLRHWLTLCHQHTNIV